MPVCLNGNTQNLDLPPGLEQRAWPTAHEYQRRAATCLNIGLINNMPDAALEATERQFVALLDAAAEGILVRLFFYALPDVPRSEWARQHLRRRYLSTESLRNYELDGLIVTGREPRTADLREEPYWGSLTKVLEWADDNTYSTAWSCLAAHAALLYLDGIPRRRSQVKRCGVFECVRLCDHPLLTGLPLRLKVPHSRWNDLSEDDLVRCGYTVLTRAGEAGADTIVKRRNSLFVFFQGHPEYEAETLLLEYRRDVKRYLAGESELYPSMPRGYFDPLMEEALASLQENVTQEGTTLGRNQELLADLTAAVDAKAMPHPWRSTAARLYSNWLAYIGAQKTRRLHPLAVCVPGHA